MTATNGTGSGPTVAAIRYYLVGRYDYDNAEALEAIARYTASHPTVGTSARVIAARIADADGQPCAWVDDDDGQEE